MQTNEPIISPEQTNTLPVADEFNSQKPVANNLITRWLLVSLIILLLGITGIFAYKYYELKQQIDKQSVPSTPPSDTAVSPSPVISPKPTIDPTANWETYTNDSMGFSFKYPQQIFQYSNPPQGDETILQLDFFNNEAKRDHRLLQGEDLELEVIVYESPKFDIQTYIDTVNASNDTIVKNPFPGITGNYIKHQDYSITGAKAAIVYSEPEGEFAEYDVIIVKNSDIFIFKLLSASHNRKEELIKVLNQILSTFKFTN